MSTQAKGRAQQSSGLRSSKMRVFACDPIGGRVGGHYLDMFSFYRTLVNYNVDLTWATWDGTPDEVEGYEFWTPFRGIYGEDPMWRRGLRYARGLWTLLRRAQKEVRQRPVVIHQQFVTFPPLELAFVLAAQRLGIPCVLTPHDIIPYGEVSQAGWLLPVMYQQYDALLVHNEASRRELETVLGKASSRTYLIPHGHLNDFRGDGPRMEQSEARLHLGISATCPVILFFGMIKKEKGLEHLLRAMPAVLEHMPDALLLVTGRPLHIDVTAYESLVDTLNIRSQVRLRWEYVPEEELPFYYRAADVVALPYTRAYQSSVCLTAYAFRRPVVASAVGGVKEQVLDRETGYLVPPADPAALAEALLKALRDRIRAEAMGERGRSWAAEAGDWDKIAAQTVEVYQELWQRRH